MRTVYFVPGSLLAHSPIWASKASLVRTRELLARLASLAKYESLLAGYVPGGKKALTFSINSTLFIRLGHFLWPPIVRWLSAKFWRDLYRADKSTKLCMVVA